MHQNGGGKWPWAIGHREIEIQQCAIWVRELNGLVVAVGSHKASGAAEHDCDDK
jgi:hypothetical protein